MGKCATCELFEVYEPEMGGRIIGFCHLGDEDEAPNPVNATNGCENHEAKQEGDG